MVGLSAKARRRLQDYPWPGNVRELRNVITRAVLFSSGHLIQESDLVFAPGSRPRDTLQPVAPPVTLPARPPREHLEARLREAEGNVSAVARELAVCTRTVYRWLKALNLDLDQLRAPFPTHRPAISAGRIRGGEGTKGR